MTPEEAAAADAEQERQIRELATQIAQMTKLGFDPMTVRKGVIAAINDAEAPPTVSINISGDTSTLVSQVRTLNNYSPVVGQTVLIGKQGTEIFILGSIASISPRSTTDATPTGNGWIQATLTNGTHGSGEHAVHYRRVLDHGSWKMQWRGLWNTSDSTTMIGSGDALDPEYRPASYRPVPCAREADGAVTIRMDFNFDGTVTVLNDSPDLSISGSALSVGGSTDVRLSGYLSSAGSDLGHAHSWGDTTTAHTHSGSSVSVDYPTWISLNGVEYFL